MESLEYYPVQISHTQVTWGPVKLATIFVPTGDPLRLTGVPPMILFPTDRPRVTLGQQTATRSL